MGYHLCDQKKKEKTRNPKQEQEHDHLSPKPIPFHNQQFLTNPNHPVSDKKNYPVGSTWLVLYFILDSHQVSLLSAQVS